MAAINWSSGCRDNPLSTPYFLLFLPLFVHLMTLFGIWQLLATVFVYRNLILFIVGGEEEAKLTKISIEIVAALRK